MSQQTCDKPGALSLPWVHKIPALKSLPTQPITTSYKPAKNMCDPHTSCPKDTTCCFMNKVGKWGCCPLPKVRMPSSVSVSLSKSQHLILYHLKKMGKLNLLIVHNLTNRPYKDEAISSEIWQKIFLAPQTKKIWLSMVENINIPACTDLRTQDMLQMKYG